MGTTEAKWSEGEFSKGIESLYDFVVATEQKLAEREARIQARLIREDWSRTQPEIGAEPPED
jgi:hypothetical protein